MLIESGYKYTEMFEDTESSLSDLKLNMSRLGEALKACKRLRRHGSASDNEAQDDIEDAIETDSEDESDGDEIEDLQDVLEDIKNFTRGLLDLSPSIDSPAKDRNRDYPSSKSPRPTIPLISKSSNPQKDAPSPSPTFQFDPLVVSGASSGFSVDSGYCQSGFYLPLLTMSSQLIEYF